MKTLFGITGIGYGHTFRQLPLVEHFARKGRVVVFAYDRSEEFYAARFRGSRTVTVVRVAVPFWVGDRRGLNFRATARHPGNCGKDFLRVTCTAFDRARRILGKPDLVITDYEPCVAQYAYACSAPLVTIDQQSKFLVGDFPTTLGGFTYRDEIERLRMFFPRVDLRIACSFFRVLGRTGTTERVVVMPSVLRDAIVRLVRRPSRTPEILVYVSAAREFVQAPAAVIRTCASQPNVRFHVFTPAMDVAAFRARAPAHVRIHAYGEKAFLDVLRTCTGIVATAGHSLLSEAMHLGIPVYAIPVAPYEQHLNAHVIDVHGFGIARPRFDELPLAQFIRNIPRFANRIHQDRQVLLRGSGQQRIIAELERRLMLIRSARGGHRS